MTVFIRPGLNKVRVAGITWSIKEQITGQRLEYVNINYTEPIFFFNVLLRSVYAFLRGLLDDARPLVEQVNVIYSGRLDV